MTERERVLAMREGAKKALLSNPFYGVLIQPGDRDAIAEKEAAALFPLPPRTVPTVRQAKGPGESGYFYRVREGQEGRRWVQRGHTRHEVEGPLPASSLSMWFSCDQSTVAVLLTLPLTEEAEDTDPPEAR